MEIALAIITFLGGVLVSHLYHRKSTYQLQEYIENLELYLKRIETNQKAMLIRDEHGKIMDVIITPEPAIAMASAGDPVVSIRCSRCGYIYPEGQQTPPCPECGLG